MKPSITTPIRKAIMLVNPGTRAFIISEHNRYRLSEWSPDGGSKDIGIGGLDKLYELAATMARAHDGILTCYGGGKEDLNFSGIPADRADVVALAKEIDRETQQRIAEAKARTK